MKMDRFYNDLAPFDDFGEFSDLQAYHPVPDGWLVVIADIRGSTKAIEAGRYKDVNMVGAAAITAVLNACGDLEVPFVFGGDGGTVIVPESLREAATQALLGLQQMSRETFGLGLRIGIVPVADLRKRGADVRIRKFRLSPGNHLAMFTGGGMELADALLKEDSGDNPYIPPVPEEAPAPDLEGLSCRWEPLKPERGEMLAVMVRGIGHGADRHGTHGADEEGRVLQETLTAFADILGNPAREAAPASKASMTFTWPPRGLALEARATRGKHSFVRRYLEVLTTSLIQLFCERFDMKAGPYNAPVYREELRANTDFRKYDDTLRMVLDVTGAQADAIERYLERGVRRRPSRLRDTQGRNRTHDLPGVQPGAKRTRPFHRRIGRRICAGRPGIQEAALRPAGGRGRSTCNPAAKQMIQTEGN